MDVMRRILLQRETRAEEVESHDRHSNGAGGDPLPLLQDRHFLPPMISISMFMKQHLLSTEELAKQPTNDFTTTRLHRNHRANVLPVQSQTCHSGIFFYFFRRSKIFLLIGFLDLLSLPTSSSSSSSLAHTHPLTS